MIRTVWSIVCSANRRKSSFDGLKPSATNDALLATPESGRAETNCLPARRTDPAGLAGPLSEQREEWWAHQDSNLERAGYEPAALTN